MPEKVNEKYKELFISESREHLDALDTGLIELEKNPTDVEVAKVLMMHSHTLKGIAATIGYGEISNLAHSFEGMVENLKNGLSSGGVTLLFGAVDELRRLVDLAETTDPNLAANPLVDEVGEMEVEDIQQAANVANNPNQIKKITEVKVRTEKLDSILETTAELMLNKMQMENAIAQGMLGIGPHLEKNTRLIEDLQYQVLQLRLTPMAQVFNRFPRMVRDLATKQEKKIEFTVTGGDIELDRSVLDDLGEPIVHLLRNAVDHGIEKEGKIALEAKRDKDMVVVKLSDTGQGIDWNQIAQKAQAAGIEDPKDYLFSGISTATEITEISGRGVGLSTVKSVIDKLNGRIDVESEPGKGTTFLLRLPVSMAIVKALIVASAQRKFAIPINTVERLIDLNSLEVSTQADQEIIVLDETEIPVIRLAKLLNITTQDTNGSKKPVLLIAKIQAKMQGFLIDRVLTQQDIVVKPIAKSLRENLKFSAVTILGEGEPVPILDLHSLVEA